MDKKKRLLWNLMYFVLGVLVLIGIYLQDLSMTALGFLFMLSLFLYRVDKLERKK